MDEPHYIIEAETKLSKITNAIHCKVGNVEGFFKIPHKVIIFCNHKYGRIELHMTHFIYNDKDIVATIPYSSILGYDCNIEKYDNGNLSDVSIGNFGFNVLQFKFLSDTLRFNKGKGEYIEQNVPFLCKGYEEQLYKE